MLLLGCYAEIARPRSAPISSTLNTGRNDRREASHRNAVSLMDENSNDRENRRSLASRPFRSTDSRLSLLSLSYSFSPLVSLSSCLLESRSASCATISSFNFASIEASLDPRCWKLSSFSLPLPFYLYHSLSLFLSFFLSLSICSRFSRASTQFPRPVRAI